jgi:hypothetical protein
MTGGVVTLSWFEVGTTVSIRTVNSALFFNIINAVISARELD